MAICTGAACTAVSACIKGTVYRVMAGCTGQGIMDLASCYVRCSDCITCLAAIGTVIGAGIGAGVGSLFSKKEVWYNANVVYDDNLLEQVKFQITPDYKGGVLLRASLSF